jgi:hypothetical protein
MIEEVIRSKWSKKYKQILYFLDVKFIGIDGEDKEVELNCYVSAILFYLDFVELVIKYKVNINPPIISVLSDGSIEIEFRKNILKQRMSPKITINFIKQNANVLILYKSSHLPQNIKGKKNINNNDFKDILETIFSASALYLDYTAN